MQAMTDQNAPSSEGTAASGQILLFNMGDVLACVDLGKVERTVSLVAMRVIPGSAGYVAGIMDYAGCSMPVIDLAIRLGLPSSPYTLNTPIIVYRHQQQRIALIVEDIIGIRIPGEQDRQLATQFARYGTAVRASVHTDQGVALLLDVSWLMQPELFECVTENDG